MSLQYINVLQNAYGIDAESKIHIQQVKEKILVLLTDHCVSFPKPVRESNKRLLNSDVSTTLIENL